MPFTTESRRSTTIDRTSRSKIRGFETVKMRNVEQYRKEIEALRSS